MREDKRRRLEAKGWKVGTAQEFLHLSTEEAAYVDLKARLATGLRDRRRPERRARRVRSSVWLAGTVCSQIVGPQPGPLRYPCQHARSDLLVLVKGEYEIGPTRPGKRPMGARLTLYRTGTRPPAHAAAKEMLRS